MRKYSGVVFDFDGVLYDSEKHWVTIENQYLMTHLKTWKPEDYKYLIGHSLTEAYAFIASKGFMRSEQQYIADYEVMATKLYAEYARPLPGVAELLRATAAVTDKIAIASSSKNAWIASALASHPLPVTIPIIVSAHDDGITAGKPASDVYLRAAQLLGIEPQMLLAIEDSRNGVRSAKAAGLYCFGLRNGFNDDQDLSSADEIITNFSTENTALIRSKLA